MKLLRKLFPPKPSNSEFIAGLTVPKNVRVVEFPNGKLGVKIKEGFISITWNICTDIQDVRRYCHLSQRECKELLHEIETIQTIKRLINEDL